MPKAVFHEDVNYDFLSVTEKKIKASRELYTIFYLDGNKGLTDLEIFEKTKELGFTGYDGLTPDCITRSNIYRWNDLVIASVTHGKKCEHNPCKKICSWGFVKNDPHFCERHKTEGMTRVVEERLIKVPKQPGQSKGKYYLDPDFAARVFKNKDEVPVKTEEKKENKEHVATSSGEQEWTGKDDILYTDMFMANPFLEEIPNWNELKTEDLELEKYDFSIDNIDIEVETGYDYKSSLLYKMEPDELLNMDLDAWLDEKMEMQPSQLLTAY